MQRQGRVGKSRWSFVLGSILVLAMAISGCSGTSNGGGGGGDTAGKSVTIQFWKAPHSDKDQAFWAEIVKDFEAKNAGIKVEHQVTPWQGWQEKYTAGFASSNPPDVTYMVDWWSAPFAKSGKLMQLDDLAKDEKSHYADSIWNVARFNGKQYGIPILTVPQFLFYNKDLFQKAGISKPPETWEEFLVDAKKLTDEKNGVYGFVFPTFVQDSYQWFLQWLWSAGGDLVSADQSKAAFNTDAGAKALDFVGNWFTKEKIVPPTGQFNSDQIEDMFVSGKAAMVVSRALLVGKIRKEQPKTNFGIVLPPAGPGGQYAFADSGYYAIAEGSKHKQEAWKFVQYITSKEVAEKYLTQVSLFPARNDVNLYKDDPVMQIFIQNTKYMRGIGILDRAEPVFQAFWGEAQKVLLGQGNAKDALKSAEQKVNTVLKGQ